MIAGTLMGMRIPELALSSMRKACGRGAANVRSSQAMNILAAGGAEDLLEKLKLPPVRIGPLSS